MASGRRLGSESSATRELIINAAVEVVQAEGTSRLTAARIAEKAGLKAHLVHYYFRNMDDLVIAVVRSYGRLGLKNAARAIVSDEPLRELWEVEMGFERSVAAMEFSTIAYHREAVQEELKRQIEEIRTLQAEAITRHLQLRGLKSPVPPLALTLILSSIARQLVREKGFGVALGHAETVQVVEEFLAGVLKSGPGPGDGGMSEPPTSERPNNSKARPTAQRPRGARSADRTDS